MDLVEVDSLFLHDRCCVGVIRNAELRDDRAFIEKMKRALGYRATLHRRDVMHIFFYIFSLLEFSGVPLPTLEELWITLDPCGIEYKSLEAFERDFQRRRQDFIKMLTTAESEVPVRALDIQASALMNRQPVKVQLAAEQIRELFLFTMLTDTEMQDAISKRTGSTSQTMIRWTKFRKLVDPIIEGTVVEPRFFSFEFRKQLFDESPVCKLCTNQINTLDDATVDHIIAYSKGGKTVPSNAQLAHRGCNAKKNAQMPAQMAAPA